ncbi:hypothetical protein BS17DRAFT_228540 [Gyrodon lividus]|nr:hypothetical protein BS17DRAFT_228540 [Gyrodon lividus]
MSERYIPPPPPYELSLQCDQKISEELQELDLSKKRPIQGEEEHGEWEDSKDSKFLAQKTLIEVTVQPLRIQKRTAASNNTGVRGPRPLPPSPADARLLGPQGRGNRRKFSPILESKAQAAEQDRMEETYSPAPPPFSAIAPSLPGPPNERTILHPSTSASPSPLNSPLQPSFGTSRRRLDNQRPFSAYSTEPRTETSFRRSSHTPIQSTSSYTLPRDRGVGMRLAFNPSVAYCNSQADDGTETQGMSAAALYSSAVSSHLNPGSRQSYL